MNDGEELPELYNDPVFKRSSYWILSTSAIFSKHFPVYGWGEVAPDGFGVAYMTGYDGRTQLKIFELVDLTTPFRSPSVHHYISQRNA